MNVGYYDDWRERWWQCGDCGWQGLGSELKTGEMFRELMEMECPGCDERLLIVSYPTLAESRANWSRLSEGERAEVEAIELFNRRFESSSLRAASQLPELAGDELVLDWDFAGTDPQTAGGGQASPETVIRHGHLEVWREPALWEGYERFVEVLGMLRERYGARLKDLVPTAASELFLYGDRLASPSLVRKARDALRRAEPPRKTGS